MRATTVRFSEDLWQLLESEATVQGISAAQFVRDTAIMRLGVLSARRGDDHATITLEQIAAGALTKQTRPDTVRDPERLAALYRTGLLDSPVEEGFDRITEIAARLLHVPTVLISLVDEDRQFFKSCLGLEEPWASARETPLSHSFCQYALASREPLVVNDARTHPTFHDNLAIRDLHVVAYLGIPLALAGDEVLGTLCAIDDEPRTWTRNQIDMLRVLATSVTGEIALRMAKEPHA